MPLQLFGRGSELARLIELGGAAVNGDGRVVLISGEAGAGKTALARAALQSSDLERMEVAASETPGHEYAPIRTLLRAAIDGGRLKHSEHSPLAILLPELGPLVPGQRPEQQLVHEAIGAAIADLAAHRPLGLLIDDCHWADSATLEALGFLAEAVSRMPVLVIACYRSEDLPRGHQLRRLRSDLRRNGRLVEIAVGVLDAVDTARLLAARLGDEPSQALADQVFGRSEGLPFFVEELAAALTESASLRAGPRGLQLDPEVALPLPESVREAVLQRVDRLSDEQRDALTWAAVAGREFDLTMTPEETIARLPATALIVDEGDGRFAFRHSLIRDALYETIPWGRRRAIHRSVAKRLEASSGPPHAIATHWMAAGDSLAGRTWLVKAARASYAMCAYRDAGAQLSRALDLWPSDDDLDGRLDVLELLARCAELGGPATLAVRALAEVIEVLETRGDRRRFADAQRRLAALLEVQGAWDRAVTARQLAAGAFAAAGEPAEAAVEHLAVAAKLRSAASFKAALELITVGKAEAEAAGRRDLQLRLLALEGNVMARAGRSGAGIALARTALSEALAGGDFATAAEAYQRLADSMEHGGDYRGARTTYLEAADFCRTNGAAAVGDVCLACLTMVLRQSGDWDHAIDVCREVLDSRSSNAHAQAVAHGVLGSILLHRGRLQQARSELHNSNVLARRIGLVAMEIDSETHLARLAVLGQRADEARERCLRMIRRWHRTDGERHYSITNFRWIASFAAQARDIEVLQLATDALTTIASQPDDEAQAAAYHALAEGLMSEGDPAAAATRFEQALTILSRLDLPLDRAEVERRGAAASALAGDRGAAVKGYRNAYRAAIRLGARPFANQIADEVAALGEKVETRLGRLAAAGVGRGGLSPRELEVTRLVASGLSSKEVATTLSLSPRTVEMHVGRILSKLDCRTRVDITRRASELGLLS
jgi:ATP/maltotriose-dependent transcriptional regulator MalT